MGESERMNSSIQPLLDEEKDDEFIYTLRRPSSARQRWCSCSTIVLAVLLAISCAANAYFLLYSKSHKHYDQYVAPASPAPQTTVKEHAHYDEHQEQPEHRPLPPHGHEASLFAGLKWDQEVAFEWSTEYADTNLTHAAELWDAINFDVGFVALPTEWTREQGLWDAQPFPWDDSQGMYVLNGYHALHCLKNVHRAIREYELDLPQSLTLPHITHCLDSLRTDILCYADDMPRYTTATKSPESAVGQPRVCRDWSKLEEWAELHTSCYNYISHKADFINQYERFKYCPKDSPYWPALREHWNKPDDWFGEDCTHGELGVEC